MASTEQEDFALRVSLEQQKIGYHRGRVKKDEEGITIDTIS